MVLAVQRTSSLPVNVAPQQSRSTHLSKKCKHHQKMQEPEPKECTVCREPNPLVKMKSCGCEATCAACAKSWYTNRLSSPGETCLRLKCVDCEQQVDAVEGVIQLLELCQVAPVPFAKVISCISGLPQQGCPLFNPSVAKL